LKVSRTIADLASCNRVEREHVAEALQYRQVEWKGRRADFRRVFARVNVFL